MSNIRTYEITHSEQKPLPIKQKDTTDYLLGGRLVMKNGKIDKVLGLSEHGHSSRTRANPDIRKATKEAKELHKLKKDNAKTDVKIKQKTTDVIQQYGFGKVAGAIVDFGRNLLGW